MSSLTIQSLASFPELIPVCAAWNLAAFGTAEDWGQEEVTSGLREIIQPDSGELALIAHWDDKPAGFALLIDCDLESHSHLKPWLASLVVAEAFRCKGIGGALVTAVEKAAAERGDRQLFLYSSTPDYYRALGWQFFETLDTDGEGSEIMSKQL